MPAFIDLTGGKYSRLTVVARAESKARRTYWSCLCECGNTAVVQGDYLKNGKTKSCGCWQREVARATRFKHGRADKTDKAYTRETHVKRKYGMTIEQYNEMFEAQNGLCAICGYKFGQKNGDCYVDHCHSTKIVRGLLCQQCNSAIGHAKDDPGVLLKAARYVSAFASPPQKFALAR
jgi:hypothetical protein